MDPGGADPDPDPTFEKKIRSWFGSDLQEKQQQQKHVWPKKIHSSIISFCTIVNIINIIW